MESFVAFFLVIGLSIEEPSLNRTTTRKALVAAKAWVSHYPKQGSICKLGEFIIHTSALSEGTANAWLGSASLHSIAKYYQLLMRALNVIMNIDLSKYKPDEYGTYTLLLYSALLETEVELKIPSENGQVEKWQLQIVQNLLHKEEQLKEEVFQKLFEYYQEGLPDLRVQFGDSADKMAPIIEHIDQLKSLITPTGICIGELDPSEEAVGLLFECSWEPEHGLGILLNNWTVEEIGHQDLAFTI
ncbi:DUF6985 domain-containing protein [Shewanella woodyi]|uniref:DUF6985 domain-containing protein n=2 Tax=Shewanella woodyi TaxID=60961 RepID=UPI00059E200D|nr:hypothetical protein [Shewanella woodyi]